MFGFLKKKLGDVISKFSKQEEPKAEEPTEKTKQPEIKQAVAKAEEPTEKKQPETKQAQAAPKQTSMLGKITQAISTTTISEQKFGEMFDELELALLENNVAVEVIGKIKEDLSKAIVDKPIPRGKTEEAIKSRLRQSIEELFTASIDIAKMAREGPKPFKIMFVGINGSGKTTTIAKVAKLLHGQSIVIAAADTFRAAAIHQLEHHAEKLGAKLIKHDYGSDPAAVAFDAISYAKAHSSDIVLIDTAGRLHSNTNLMDEMKKVARVAKPDLKIFVGESITGNDCVEQARQFNNAIGIDGIILTKADVDEKGGAAISASYVTGKPIIYIGTGQEYEDLATFRSEQVAGQLGLTD